MEEYGVHDHQVEQPHATRVRGVHLQRIHVHEGRRRGEDDERQKEYGGRGGEVVNELDYGGTKKQNEPGPTGREGGVYSTGQVSYSYK